MRGAVVPTELVGGRKPRTFLTMPEQQTISGSCQIVAVDKREYDALKRDAEIMQRRDAVKSADYRGMHYPTPLFMEWPSVFYWFWRKWFCTRERHLFSEVYSPGCPDLGPSHYLNCDACQLVVEIAGVSTKHSEKFGITQNSPFGESQ